MRIVYFLIVSFLLTLHAKIRPFCNPIYFETFVPSCTSDHELNVLGNITSTKKIPIFLEIF